MSKAMVPEDRVQFDMRKRGRRDTGAGNATGSTELTGEMKAKSRKDRQFITVAEE
jgi:hypothetical protein